MIQSWNSEFRWFRYLLSIAHSHLSVQSSASSVETSKSRYRFLETRKSLVSGLLVRFLACSLVLSRN